MEGNKIVIIPDPDSYEKQFHKFRCVIIRKHPIHEDIYVVKMTEGPKKGSSKEFNEDYLRPILRIV